MNKETKIAKENIKKVDFDVPDGVSDGVDECLSHKQTCQRWLEKDSEEYKKLNSIIEPTLLEKFPILLNLIGRKRLNIEDKKQAIKLYEDAGI